MAKIEGMALNVVLQLAKAELMSAYRTDNVKIMGVDFDWDVCEGDEDGERSLMVDACIMPKEECFKKDSGRHPWLMVWDEETCEFHTLMRWDQDTDDDEEKDGELPSNVVARLDYAAQSLDTLELSPADDVDVNGELPYAVTTIRMDYPFEIEGNGSYNVYKIAPAKTWGELLTETIKVFQREYEAGKAVAPHQLSDYIIERVDVHPGDLATICIGS